MSSTALSILRRRLPALLVLLLAANLGAYQEQSGPSCTCSGYQGRLVLADYLYVGEGQDYSVEAFFPSPADWALGELPSADVVDSVGITSPAMGATNLVIGLSTVFQFTGLSIENDSPIGNFSNFDRTTLRPHIRTRLEVMATPVDPQGASERRALTILGQLPFLEVVNPRVRLTRSGMDRFVLTATVDSADSHPSWVFDFDLSQAPGLSGVLPLEIDSRQARVEFVLADELNWDNGSDLDDPICLLREPFMVIARESGRNLVETRQTWIIGIRDSATGECPQPRDYR